MNSKSDCILCGSTENTLIQTGMRHAPQLEVHRCAHCGLVYSWPRPTEEELGQYYSELYHQDYGDPSVEERYRTDLDEAHSRVRRLLPFLHSDMRLMEVGSGSGAFIDAVHSHVGEVVGVEPDAASRVYIADQMKLTVVERVTDILHDDKTFDVVVLFHVLEHIPDPVRFLQSLSHLLRPDGRLVLEVPSVDDVLVAVYKIPAYLRFYYQKTHLYYFSGDTLTAVLSQAGFEASIEGIQRYDLSNHIYWMLKGQPGGQNYYKDLLPPSVNAAYADALIRADRSDTLWAVAKKMR